MRQMLCTSASLAVLSTFVLVSAAQAQDPGQASDASARIVDEIIVTAQKREQRLQDVPIVVTSLSGQTLQDSGVRDIRELTILTPGLTVTSTTSETVVTARIRGVGTVGDNPGLESSVGVVIDGVYRPRNGVSFGDLGEVQRIEVLKGPQGTLFGKNTSAGVINIITAPPTRDVQAESEFSVGNYGAVGFSGSLSGPITDALSGRVFAAARARDGFQDVFTGAGPRGQTDDNDQHFYTVRGQLLFSPLESFDLRIIGDYTKREEFCCVGVQLAVGAGPSSRASSINAVRPGSIDPTSTPFDRQGYANRDTNQDVEDMGLSAEATWQVNDAVSLTSITAWRDWKTATGQDTDFTAADLLYRPGDGRNQVEFEQVSQELRLAGEAGPLNWLVGGFYAKENLKSRSLLLYGSDFYAYWAGQVLGGVPTVLGLVPGSIYRQDGGQDDTFDQDDTTWALFTNNSYAFTDALELTVGLRYTRDEKDIDSRYTTTASSCDQGEAAFGTIAGLVGQAAALQAVGGMCINTLNDDFDDLGLLRQSRKEEEVSGTAKLAYRWTSRIMTYASYSRGYKAGGYNLDREGRVLLTPTGPNFAANPDTSFAPELVDSYELGAKTSWLDGALILNAAAFHQTFTDFQLNTFEGAQFIVETIPEVVSRGVDADFIYTPPIDGLTLQGGVTYAQTEYSPFTAADLKVASRYPSLRRLPGARISFAPLWSATLAGSYERDLGDNLTLRTSMSGKYTSSYNTGSDLHPSKVQDDLVLVNARIGFGSRDERWAIELWSQNLFDQDYLQVGFNGPYQYNDSDAIAVYDAFLGAPRTYGVTLRLRH
ncbi:MAG: TonB-dependent receptor [Phenylobacterium sp.]|uniref:TonB-dependent receptor n=1 Tax=Phenylobacterium sp. TaxID=1871053 RepID=UPI002734EA99|nr:TonB-dependent receptor [Phenylobacterium sp.]MDP3174536.1 TonB-dependent receptor [Phenylobacterium sp.]